MSPSDALPSEMPGFPFPGRPGGEHDEPLLDMILGRRALPPDAPPEIHDLASMLAALWAEAEPGELAAEAHVRAAFTRLGPLSQPRSAGRLPAPARVSHRVRRPTRHRRRRWARGSLRPRVGLAASLVAGLAGLVIIATYAGDLPGPVQRLAHSTVAAPAPASARPQVTTTLDNRQGVRRPTRETATPVRPSTHRATSPATGNTSTPRHSPESSPSRAYHPGTEGCSNDLWWPGQPRSPVRGYHGVLPFAQPNRCPDPDTYPSTPSLGSSEP
jgi:hypothetical protein